MHNPMVPIDPGRTYSLAEIDRIRDQGDRYEAMLDRKYDSDGIPRKSRRDLAPAKPKGGRFCPYCNRTMAMNEEWVYECSLCGCSTAD